MCMSMRRRSEISIQVSMHRPTQPTASTMTSVDEVATGSLGRGDFYWGGAASTIFWVDPVEDLVVVFMTQLFPSGTFDFRGQLKSIVYGALDD